MSVVCWNDGGERSFLSVDVFRPLYCAREDARRRGAHRVCCCCCLLTIVRAPAATAAQEFSPIRPSFASSSSLSRFVNTNVRTPRPSLSHAPFTASRISLPHSAFGDRDDAPLVQNQRLFHVNKLTKLKKQSKLLHISDLNSCDVVAEASTRVMC
ncbi:hypothetical protein ANCCAN_14053 [Ancylostoma caninum]|uniref:Uncharacterized protein n=1 Tax=Ancylostoma caninum TaxID=29170 RepID=A0A368G6N2_ANCCA|nr:hypothetical protein ANCCAN_14053 [Ancylostoma caninum]